jgi:hypothetical protein
MNRFLLRNIMAYVDCQRVFLTDVDPYDMSDFFDALIQGQFPLMKSIELMVSVLLLALCTFAVGNKNVMRRLQQNTPHPNAINMWSRPWTRDETSVQDFAMERMAQVLKANKTVSHIEMVRCFFVVVLVCCCIFYIFSYHI